MGTPGGRYDDFVPSKGFRGALNKDLSFHSYSGTDIQCFFFGDDLTPITDEIDASTNLSNREKELLYDEVDKKRRQTIKPFGELQTLTVSSARSFGPVRRLGELTPVDYKGGARTIAGTMIFAVLNRDVFADYLEGLIPGIQDDGWSGPTFVDEIPPFNILIRGGNEYGALSNGILTDVVISNFGTTFSVDDLYTEATYNYIARHYFPFTDDWKRAVSDAYKLGGTNGLVPLSQKTMVNSNFVRTSNGSFYWLAKEDYDFIKSIPQNQHQKLIDMGPTYVRALRLGTRL